MSQHLLLALILSSASPARPQDDTTSVPAGTPVPVRFLTGIESGKTRAGWTVEGQTMADVVAGGCVVIPAYTRLLGIVDESLGGWLFRRRGRLHLTFEDANLGPGAWVEGSEDALVEAFTHADWVVASSGGLRSRVGAAGAVVLGKSYTHAPVSPQRLFGRVEDLAFERQGANARERHHVRMWALDSTRTTWVGAANEDVGVYVTVAKPRITHRIAPDLDGERDLLARELEGGGCARRRGYIRTPRCPLGGRNSSGEEFATDGRAVVVRLKPCGGS